MPELAVARLIEGVELKDDQHGALPDLQDSLDDIGDRPAHGDAPAGRQ